MFDPAGLKRLQDTLGGQAKALLPSLLDSFYEEAPKLLGEARRALEEERVTDLRRAAHTLKSNSVNFGVMALAQVARELEYLARDGVLEGALALIARAESAFPQAQAALEDAREGL